MLGHGYVARYWGKCLVIDPLGDRNCLYYTIMIYTGNYDHRNILKNKQGAEEMQKAVNVYLSHHLEDICYTESRFTVRSDIEDNLLQLKIMYPSDPLYDISESDVECYMNIMNDAGAHCRYATDLEVYAIAHIHE